MIRQKTLLRAGLGLAGWLAYRVYQASKAYSFAGKTVFITGGTRGLGLVMARRLAREGANLAVCARDPEEVRRAEDDLIRHGTRVVARTCDLRYRDHVRKFLDEVRQRLGPIDVLINNAGIISVGPVETMTLADFYDAMAINYFAAVHTILEVLPEMRERRQGRILNVTSIGGKISVPHLLPYSASKFALVGLSEGLRAELVKDGIIVTTVCPFLMRTGSPRNASFKGQHRAEYAWFALSDSIPGIAMGADRAARKILNACRYGQAEVVLSLPGKLAALVHGIAPGLVSNINGWVNRFLPGPGGIGTQTALGWQSESKVAPSWLTGLTERAARENNEMELPSLVEPRT
ncbi:MAG TPA: SDR family oxidoreductase [Gemmataceae bacterium]|nr:SDR family oxidoreductase [Gemmataceae bacterium]